MKEELRAMVFGAFFGGLAAAGFIFLCFWWIMWTSPKAGAMVGGTFRPYQQDSSIHATALGGAVLLGAGLVGLGAGWRKIGRGKAL